MSFQYESTIDTTSVKLSNRNYKSKIKNSTKNQDETYIHAPIDTFGLFGRWLRITLLNGILVGTPVSHIIQNHRTPTRTKLMKTLTFFGSEIFFTCLFLLFYWLIEAKFGRLFGVLMWVGFYIAGFLKTLLCLPRPACPPVFPLEKAYDWALPSLHSMLGVIMPWYIWLYTKMHYELSSLSMGILCSIIILWSFGVMLSRLYLGVHSPADIVSGGVIGVIILCVWIQIDDLVDLYLAQQQLEFFAVMTLLLCIHPITYPGDTSFLDVCILYGVSTGILLAQNRRSQMLNIPALISTIEVWSIGKFVYMSLARFILGAVIIFLLKFIIKVCLMSFFENLYPLLGLPMYNSDKYRKSMPSNPRHYTNLFKIPPVNGESSFLAKDRELLVESDSEFDDTTMVPNRASYKWFEYLHIYSSIMSLCVKNKREAWDIVVPVKLITYTIITYVAVGLMPELFIIFSI